MKETLKRREILRYEKDLARVMSAGTRVSGQVLYLRAAQATDSPAPSPARRSAPGIPSGVRNPDWALRGRPGLRASDARRSAPGIPSGVRNPDWGLRGRPGLRASDARRIAFLLGRGISPAVRRNRLKRRLREIYRRNREWFPEGYDYVLHATPDAADLPYRHLVRHVQNLTKKLARGTGADERSTDG